MQSNSNSNSNGIAPIVTTDELIGYLNFYLQSYKLKNVGLIEIKSLPNNKSYIALSFKSSQFHKSEMSKVVDNYISYAQNKFNENVIEPKKQFIIQINKNLEKSYNDLKSLLPKNMTDSKNSFDDTKAFVQLSEIQSDIQNNNLALSSFKSFKVIGGLIQSNKPVGLSKSMILVLGIVLSIILALVIIFLVEFFVNLSA